MGNIGHAARIQRLRPARFQTAVELGDCCLGYPDTVFAEGPAAIRVIKKIFFLPGVGSLGALALSSEGRLTFILSALSREQSSHTLSGQIIASSAALAPCSISDLDHLVDGQLFRAFEQQAGALGATPADLLTQCSEALEHRAIDFVVAMDECSDTLVSTLRFLDSITPIRIRLVEISRFFDENDTQVIVPKTILGETLAEHTPNQNASRDHEDLSKARPPSDPQADHRADNGSSFQAPVPGRPPTPEDASEIRNSSRVQERALAALAAVLEHKPEQLRVFDDGTYARLARQGWPRHLHYAFVEDNGTNALAIHLENDFVRPLANILIPMTEEFSALFPAATVVWDPTWSKNRGRLAIRPNDVDPATLAKVMLTLIERSAPQLDAALNSLRKPAWAPLEQN